MTPNSVALLGTKGGPAIRTGSTMPTSSLLTLNHQQIVIDCGLGVTRGLVDQGFALKDLDVIFITHLHSDHYLELGPLIHTAWTAGLKTKVAIWGPVGIATYWDNFIASMADDIDLRITDEGRPDIRDLVTLHTIDAGHVTTMDDIDVTAMRVDHPPLKDCFALSFKTATRHVVFSGDTTYCPALADFARGADILIHEAMLQAALAPLVARVGNGDDRLMQHLLRSHTTAQDAARIAADAGVKVLALHHLLPSDDPDFGPKDWDTAVRAHWDGQYYLGTDGMRIDLD